MHFRHFIIGLLISLSALGQKQEISFEATPQKLLVGETLKWKIIIKGVSDFEVSELPKIQGFKKEGRLASHTAVLISGKRVLQHTITQNYTALEPGTFQSPAGTVTINGIETALPSFEVNVVSNEVPEEEQFTQMADGSGSRLFLFVDKKEVFVGEAIHVHLAYYVSEDNPSGWQFASDLNKQVADISTAIKPKNCLESRKNIVDIQPEPATIGGRNYIRYKIYEAFFYPLTEDDIRLSAQSLTMERQGAGKDSLQIVKQAFSSLPFSVKVNPLPEHPLKDKAAVGNYTLTEPAKFGKLQTGKVINYPIVIKGMGNTNSLRFDPPFSDGSLDFYPPSVSGNQPAGDPQGVRIFTFKIFPKDSGSFELSNYFQWIYFNTSTATYDTLRASGILHTQGERVESSFTSAGDIYAGIDSKLITEKQINYRKIIKNVSNVLLILMLAAMLFIFDLKRQKPH